MCWNHCGGFGANKRTSVETEALGGYGNIPVKTCMEYGSDGWEWLYPS